MKTRTPNDLFFDQLHDLYSVETQLVAALPRLVPLTTNSDLRALIALHANQTENQREMVIKIFEGSGMEIGDDTSKAMKGLIKGGHSHLKAVKDPMTRDLMMIAHCLRIEYYEIAAYGITARLAQRLDLAGEAEILHQIRAEEEAAARQLIELEPQVFDTAIEG